MCLYVPEKKEKKNGFLPGRIVPAWHPAERDLSNKLLKAPTVDPTKPLLFGAADRGPQGENLKDFNNTSNPRAA